MMYRSCPWWFWREGGFLTIYAGNITSYSNATFAAGYGGGGGGGGGRNSYEDKVGTT